MKIGLLGPTDPEFICKIIGKEMSSFIRVAERVGKILALGGYHMVICPDTGWNGMAITAIVAKSYRDYGGTKIIGVVPQQDERWGSKTLSLEICDEIVNCISWGSIPVKLVEICDSLIVLGLSPGTMIELCWGKWIRRKFYIIKEFVSYIPKEILGYINIEWIDNIDALEVKLALNLDEAKYTTRNHATDANKKPNP